MEQFQHIMNYISVNFWNIYMIGFLLGTGLLLTFITGGIQIRELFTGVKLIIRGALRKDESEKEKGEIAHTRCCRVHPAILVARAAQKIHENSLLWFSVKPVQEKKLGDLPKTHGCFSGS